MLKRIFCQLLFVMCLIGAATANQRYQGTCQQSGVTVLAGLNSTTTSPLTYPGATVTVTIVGGGIATIFSDNLGTPLANPFTASGTDATFSFYAANTPAARYSVTCSGTGIPTISINPDVVMYDPAVAIPGVFTTGNFSGNVTVGGTLGVTGPSTLSSGGTFTGTFTGNPTFSGNPIFSGAVSGSTTGTLGNFSTINNVLYTDSYKAASTTCGFAEANAAAAAIGLGNTKIMMPSGICTATATIPVQDGIDYGGYGGKSRTNSLNECGTLIKSTTTDVFTYSGTKSGDFGLHDFCAWSGTGGGDVLKFTASTSRLKIHDFYLQQDNAAKGAIVSTTATNSFVGNKFYEGLIVYSVTPTASAINVVSNAMNSVVFDNIWIQTSVAGAVTAPTITINDTGVNACASEMVLRNIQIEPPGGANNYVGGISASGVCGLLLDTVDVDATGYTPTGPAISITPVSTLPSGITAPITIMNSTSYTGTNAFPDLFVAKTTPSQVTLIGNNFLWIGGSAGNPFTYVDINNNIANQHDTTLALGITATGQIKSSLATGTAPLVIASTTPVANLSLSGGAGTGIDNICVGCVTPAAGHFTTASVTGQITSTLAIGTAPLVIASTTPVANLTVQNCGATCAITQPTISTGISQGSGLKHQRFGVTCTTAAAANAACNTTYTWTSAFANASYTVVCSPLGAASGVPIIQQITNVLAASFDLTIIANSAVGAQLSGVQCIATHD